MLNPQIKLVLLFMLFSYYLSAQEIIINEVMSSNSEMLDEEGDSPDWIELYNTTNRPVNLNGWTISDNIDKPAKWPFPEMILQEDDYLFIWASGKDRSINGSIRTHIDQGDNFKYIIPTTNPNSNWDNISYNDSNWQTGPSGFGFGDSDDATQIPLGTRSIFLRKKFSISDTALIEKIILHADYDDGFVAYINGVEVARANVAGNPPIWNQRANTDHEAQIYRGGAPEIFTLEDIRATLVEGDNLLAIQAHNVSNSSSDFTIIPFLSIQYNTQSTEGDRVPDILNLSDLFLHTNFKISATKETIYLFNNNNLIDSMLVENVPADISTGISLEGEQVLFAENTPGKINDAETFIGAVDQQIKFSQEGGKVSPFNLELSGVESPFVIRYTLDSSEPNETSQLYTGALSITATSIVRARVFKEGFIPSSIATKVYRIGSGHNLPVIDLVTERSNLYDTNNGIYVFGTSAESTFPHFGANFWEDWEVPVYFSYSGTDGSSIDFNAGMKIFGGWSRGFNQKSLSIFARGRYGTSEFSFPFFDNRPYDKFQSLVLRNSGNDWGRTMFRDGMITSLMEGSGLDLQAYKPTVVYLNGQYWGIHNMREKINEHFVASKHNVNTEDVDILEKNGELIFGDNKEYLDLIQFVNSHNFINIANYRQVEEQVDIENMITYQAAQIYFNNTDWPGNNIKFFKFKGGKWRWVLFDTDFGLDIWNNNAVNNNTLAFALDPDGPNWPNPPWSTLLFRKLMENQEYKNRFINRFADEMNSRFLSTNIKNHIDQLANAILSEIPIHFERWNGDLSGWGLHVTRMKAFASSRSSIVKNHILTELQLPNYHNITISNPNSSYGYVRLNSLVIEDSYWQGDYFESVPIKLIAIPREGYKFSHWEGKSSSTDQEINIDLTEGSSITPVFEEDNTALLDFVINEINYNSSDDHDTGDWIELYNPSSSNKDISNWIIKDNDDDHGYIIPDGTLIDGEGYIVITKDNDKFKLLHEDINNVIGDLSFGLSSNEDEVRLYSPTGELKDSVSYSSTAPWPEAAAGQGYTLELKEPGLDNTLPENWSNIHEYGSPGKSNLESTSNKNIIDQISLQLTPNPSDGVLNIRFNVEEPAPLRINILDLSGRLIKTIADRNFNTGKHNLTADIPALAAGIYILNIGSSQNLAVANKKFYKN